MSPRLSTIEQINLATDGLARGDSLKQVAEALGVSPRSLEYLRHNHRKEWDAAWAAAVENVVK